MTFSTSIFYCDSCSLPIPASSPRVHCLSPVCADNYDLCATCSLGERFLQGSGDHLLSHPTQVYKISGNSDDLLRKGGLDNGATANSVTSTATITYFDRAVGSPTSKSLGRPVSRNQPWSTHHHRRSSGNSSISSIGSLGSVSSSSSFGPFGAYSPATSISTSPPPSFEADYCLGDTPSQTACGPRRDILPRAGWSAFFMPDMTPSSTLLKLLNAIFSSLDRQGTGYLTPEAYSRFLDDLGYDIEDNVWKSYLRPVPGFAMEDVADQALRTIFDLFSIEYTLAVRTLYEAQPPYALDASATLTEDAEPDMTALTDQLQSLLGKGRGTDFATGFIKTITDATQARQARSRLSRMRSTSSSSSLRHARRSTMPLLTRAGFISLTCLNVLCDPDAEWIGFCRLLKDPHYQEELGSFNRVFGPLPRRALPGYPDQMSVQRVQDVFDHAERMKVSEKGKSGMSMRSWNDSTRVSTTLYTTS